jgi:hypothetical protein
MWGFLFLILGVPYLTLLLGALALYWGISSLRGKAKTPTSALTGGSGVPGAAGAPGGAAGAPSVPGAQGGVPVPQGHGYYSLAPAKPQAPAAIGGLIAGAVALALVAVVFGVQLYYKSYYDCQANAPTQAAQNACASTVSPRPPAWLVQLNRG